MRRRNEALVTWYELAPHLVWRVRYGKGFDRMVEVLRRPEPPDEEPETGSSEGLN